MLTRVCEHESHTEHGNPQRREHVKCVKNKKRVGTRGMVACSENMRETDTEDVERF